jgi:hypothetical protein
MPRAKVKWRETEMTRAVRAIEKATGKPVQRVEVDSTGKIIVFPGGDDETAPINNEWDEAVK